MESIEERLKKLREDRIAREKARIEKLRELNLKKYNKNEPLTGKSVTSIPVSKNNNISNSKNLAKSNIPLKRSISAPINKDINKPKSTNLKVDISNNNAKVKKSADKLRIGSKIQNNINTVSTAPVKDPQPLKEISDKLEKKELIPKIINSKKPVQKTNPEVKTDIKQQRQSIAVFSRPKPKPLNDRKSMPSKPHDSKQISTESVFDRLYKPKTITKQPVDNAHKLKTDPNYLKKIINNSSLIINKRHTVFETKQGPVRRSISAVHFKRISKSELNNCVHKWASIGEKINKAHIKEVNEDEGLKDDKVLLTVKSERKKVKFMTPSSLNTPKPEELQSRLQNWLQKRGKSIDSYHHLQCFGLHHLSNGIKPFNIDTPRPNNFDDENKENIALENDSDNESFSENMNEEKCIISNGNRDNFSADKWRRASYALSDSIDLNESFETTLTSAGTMHHIDELLLGALSDLTELLREGFDWEQCARWLRAIRDRFPHAPDTAPYWECRAALEERRGDLPASVQCWEQAIAKGTENSWFQYARREDRKPDLQMISEFLMKEAEMCAALVPHEPTKENQQVFKKTQRTLSPYRSVVEANLDQLLDKFMQLKISPGSKQTRQVDPKLLDVKNVFKSTIIRFAVQQAKLRQSSGSPKFTVTPVRRSSRLSLHTRKTPLRVCTTLHQAALLGPTEFRPNKALTETP